MKFNINYQLVGKNPVVGKDPQLEFHTHSQFEIYYFHGGDCNFQVGTRFYSLNPEDLLLIDGMNTHKAFVNEDNTDYQRSVIHFEGDWLQDVLEAMGAENLLNLFTEETGALYRFNNENIKRKIGRLFFDLNQIYQNKESHYLESQLQLLLIQLLIEIDSNVREDFADIEPERDENLAKVENIVAFLTTHYQERITLVDIAEGVNISKSYLSHLFKDVTGMTVMNFLMEYRLTQSVFNLLMQPSLSVTEVAALSGFESNAHFSRFFKKHMGTSPLQFRQERISGNDFL